VHQNIPQELRALRQWVVSGPNKLPFNPRTGAVASPTDPSTWGSFEEALATGAPKIGFVLTKEDPYCVIDLDDKEDNPASDDDKARFAKILAFFNSYTEVSTSGRGIHIVLKGSIPHGVNRDHTEMYSDARYIIFTGNVLKNLPIADGYQETLSAMYEAMRPRDESIELVEVDAIVDDEYIWKMATNAENKEKFNALCSGDTSDYPSPSEADLALLSIIAYYTQSDEQVRRIFRQTHLGQRMKDGKPRHSNDKAIDYALRKVRAKQPPPVDLSMILNNSKALNGFKHEDIPAVTPPPPPPPLEQTNVSLPPGLVGLIAQWVYQASDRPVPEVALATALALVAGVAGRAYNISNTGLNQYMVLIAKTGSGKDIAGKSIGRLLGALRSRIPAAMDFYGPGTIASGPAIHKELSRKPCFVTVFGEFGLLMEKMTGKNASTPDQSTKKFLLEVYGRSGRGDTIQSMVYSDKEKNVDSIASPALTLLGESTPESFYDNLDASTVSSGFLPRFFIIEYFGDRPKRNPNPGAPPSDYLLNCMADVVTIALTAQANNTTLPVQVDLRAQQLLDAFDLEADAKMSGQGDVLTQVWNRAHLKALKLAGVIAVGVNWHEPVVTEEVARWAIDLIRGDSLRLAKRFQAGDVGAGDGKQQSEIIRLIEQYANGTVENATKYDSTAELHTARAISYKYLLKRTYSLSAFRNDRRGSTEALNKALQAMVDSGQLIEIDRKTLTERLKYGGKAYGIGGHWG
jgi:hypothetical protein